MWKFEKDPTGDPVETDRFLEVINAHLDGGLCLLIHSEVPPGKGVASSAALEVAAMQAICGVYNLPA